ncbi:hypothetical protein BQ8794_320041 [Mesorhizobium prunaredense]|uniref:Uncharacterized protein n=1 Tax=Mesorhizobium prunaredense TaxID=1631249 RepID=A0A1R3VBG7_9HYPH|nr:hypothetical protein BQ8794_320041 [Mesorhizobium prunaredense]
MMSCIAAHVFVSRTGSAITEQPNRSSAKPELAIDHMPIQSDCYLGMGACKQPSGLPP